MIGAYILSGELTKMRSNNSEETAAALRRYEETHRALIGAGTKPPAGFPQLANPQTQLGVSVMHSILKLAYWSKIQKLVGGLGIGENKSQKSSLPDYGW
jgi:hypothetical protein